MIKNPFNSFDVRTIRKASEFRSINRYGVCLCLRGDAEITIGKKRYHVARNYMCLYAPFSDLSILDCSHDFMAVVIEEKRDILYKPISLLSEKGRIAVRQTPCVKLSEEQQKRIRYIAHLLNDRIVFYRQKLNAQNSAFIEEALLSIVNFGCFDILTVYFESEPIPNLMPTRSETIYDRFICSLLVNYTKERTVAYYAAEQHLSPAYFSVIIRDVSGKSVMQWIVEVTIMRAKQVLCRSRMSIKEIAEEFHFQDQSSFGRYFKNYVGVSPKCFRNEHSLDDGL